MSFFILYPRPPNFKWICCNKHCVSDNPVRVSRDLEGWKLIGDDSMCWLNINMAGEAYCVYCGLPENRP